jgi:hypothetical protein
MPLVSISQSSCMVSRIRICFEKPDFMRSKLCCKLWKNGGEDGDAERGHG